MRRFTLIPVLVSMLLLARVNLRAQTPQWSTGSCKNDPGNTHNNWLWTQQAGFCELPRTVLPLAGGQVNLAGKDGGIDVIGEDRTDIELEVRVTAYAGTSKQAEHIAHQVKIICRVV